MNQAPQERARRQDNGAAAKFAAVGRYHRRHPPIDDLEVFCPHGDDGQVRIVPEFCLHVLAVKLAVGLGPRAPDGRTLGPVQHAELDAGAIGHAAHQAVEGIDFPDQVALAQAPESRVARHLAERLDLVCHQGRTRAHACRRRRCFTAGVASSNHNDVELRAHPAQRIAHLP